MAQTTKAATTVTRSRTTGRLIPTSPLLPGRGGRWGIRRRTHPWVVPGPGHPPADARCDGGRTRPPPSRPGLTAPEPARTLRRADPPGWGVLGGGCLGEVCSLAGCLRLLGD